MLFPSATPAQVPSLSGHTVSSISSIQFPHSRSSGKGKNKAEVPPWIIPGGLRSYFFVDGCDTYIWSSGNSLVHDKTLDLDHANGPSLASGSYTHSPAFDHKKPLQNWKRNYYGIYSAQYIRHPEQGPVSLALLHGENKNMVSGRDLFQNTIQPNVLIDRADHRTWSGGNPFLEGWNAYNAMISAAWTPNSAATNWGQQLFDHELGPIAWPSTAYTTKEGVKCTSGLKHPSSIIAGEFLYVFYADGGPFGSNIPQEEGRQEGIKVVRVPVANALDPAAYQVYYKTPAGQASWLPSLPPGFTKETMLDYVSVQGSPSTDIMNDHIHQSQEIRFSVAKVRHTNYFIGVEEYIDVADHRKFKVALRFSEDLVTWTDRVLVVAEAASWEKTQLNYPIFLDKEGWSNTEIDIDDFYILGTGITPGTYVNKVRLLKSETNALQGSRGAPVAQQVMNASPVNPNPNDGAFQVAYQLEQPSRVQISLLDISGRRLGPIKNELHNQGTYTARLDIRAWPPGIYLVEIRANDQRWLHRVVKR